MLLPRSYFVMQILDDTEEKDCEIPPGTFVAVIPTTRPKMGSLVAVRVDQTYFVARYLRKCGHSEFIFPTYRVAPPEDEYEILGEVIPLTIDSENGAGHTLSLVACYAIAALDCLLELAPAFLY
jgi:hypothetical protein